MYDSASPVPPAARQTLPQNPTACTAGGAPVGWIESIETRLWSSQPAGAVNWKPEEVHVVLMLKAGPDDPREPMQLVLRYKSRPALEEQIAALYRSMNAVWPAAPVPPARPAPAAVGRHAPGRLDLTGESQ